MTLVSSKPCGFALPILGLPKLKATIPTTCHLNKRRCFGLNFNMLHGKLGASVDRSGLRLHKVVDAPEITLPFPAAAQ